jgi:hypothetical protein
MEQGHAVFPGPSQAVHTKIFPLPVRPSPSLTIVLRHSPHLQAAIVELHLRGNGCIHPADPRLPAIIMQRQGQPTLMPMIQRAIEVTIKLATSPFFMDVQMDFV